MKAKPVSRRKHPSTHNPHARSLGRREDGTEKGLGYLGPVKNPNGGVSTELSMGVHMDGKERLVPLMVPTLTPGELTELLRAKGLGQVPRSVKQKAVDHARMRVMIGKPVFFD